MLPLLHGWSGKIGGDWILAGCIRWDVLFSMIDMTCDLPRDIAVRYDLLVVL